MTKQFEGDEVELKIWCDICGGTGQYADHTTLCMGYNCDETCPVQVQCENCCGKGYYTKKRNDLVELDEKALFEFLCGLKGVDWTWERAVVKAHSKAIAEKFGTRPIPTTSTDDVREELEEMLDNITEGRLKNVDCYTPSFTGSSKTPMIKYLADAILENFEVRKK